jgi:PEP-CTERM motif
VSRNLIGLTFALTLAAGTAQAGLTIDTTPSWDGSSVVFPWGHNDVTETYGQTVTAPAGAKSLNQFSFLIQDVNDYEGIGVPGPITYQAYVYAWDPVGQHITGSPLFQSSVLQTPGTNTGNFFSATFNTPGAAVTPNAQYIMFLTTDGITSPTDGNTAWAFPFSDVYSGGAFRFMNDPNFADLSTTVWSDSSAFGGNAGDDLIFTATFNAPEPASLGVLGLGLAALGLMRRGRRWCARQDSNLRPSGYEPPALTS